MKLSTRGRYSARLMLQLAIHYGKGPLYLKQIAKAEDISEKYLGQLVSALKTARLVNSSRGSHGGYMLAREPKSVRLGDIIRAVEGSLAPVECVNDPSICDRTKKCITIDIWKLLGQKINKTLDSITLEDMVKMQLKKDGKQQNVPNYNI